MAVNVISASSNKTISRPSTVAALASMAVLVADGASPTQAHVTTANSDLNALLGAGFVSIHYDTTATKNQVKEAINAILQAFEGIS